MTKFPSNRIIPVTETCTEDCHQGLIFVYEKEVLETPTVFRCYCAKGNHFKHYTQWHPVLFQKKYKKFLAEDNPEILKKYFPDKVIKPPPMRNEIPDILIPHFEKGDFISETWELHKETYGREQLATWYKQWKAKN